MSGIGFDFSEVRKLAADLSEAESNAAPLVRKAVEVSARRVKDAARDNMRDVKYMPHIPAAVDYDLLGSGDGITAEVGFDRGKRQGQLGNIYEYGSRFFPARGPLTHALHENEADFVKGITLAATDALGGLA